MKTISVETVELPEIKDDREKACMKVCIDSLRQYYENHRCQRSYFDIHCGLMINKHYIHMFFQSADYLYQYYEFDQIFFVLLDRAATHLEDLSQRAIVTSLTEEAKTATKQELGDYLDKVTLIFQTAVDKAGNEDCVRFCTDKVGKYSARADAAHGLAVTPAYAKKILALYEKAAEEHKDDFFGEIFESRAKEYRRACEVKEISEMGAASRGLFGDDATDGTPLLKDSDCRSGFRRRTSRHEEERPTSSPSP